ncbi:MAG: peptidoglycan-binding protein [Lactobacillus sp.]|jgi:hypothetical protein|nr:peptidoglycan-binding protein [Lactobacillus sp.]
MAETKSGIVHVSSYTRNGQEVSAHTRSTPPSSVRVKEKFGGPYNSNPQDNISLKEALSSLGYYKAPDWGIDGYASTSLLNSVKDFQKDNSLTVDGNIFPNGETEKKLNENLYKQILRKAKYSSAAAMQGQSLGFSDEIEGVLGGIGYGIGSLNPKWNKKNETVPEAIKRGYIENRDNRRAHLEEAYRESPFLTGASEAIGAISSPAGQAFKAAKTAPLGVKSRKNITEAIATGGTYGVGVSENEKKDYAKNIGLGIAGNYIGYRFSNNILGRSGSPLARSLINEGIGSLLKNGAKLYKKYNDE